MAYFWHIFGIFLTSFALPCFALKHQKTAIFIKISKNYNFYPYLIIANNLKIN
tara:strand:+ start:420 stop:578 length:159 start_codon:yes stop_codon:yes gene_type:complete